MPDRVSPVLHEDAVRERSPRSDTRERRLPQAPSRSSMLPLWGMILAAVLIVSRRPDAITNAQFWAEDGKFYYTDVYNHGLLATLLVPQAGYFQGLAVLAAGFAQLVPLAHAPLVSNCVAILVRVLPVGLLLSRRAEPICRDLRVRALLAALYIALPGTYEANATAVNASWFLALSAVLVLMLSPPDGTLGRVLDTAILVLFACTGVYVIVLAPIAFAYRRLRGSEYVSTAKLAILAAGAALQLLAIFVLEYHLPAGFEARPRPSAPLHATFHGFFEILGLRVLAQPVAGNSVSPSAALAIVLGVVGIVGALVVLVKGTPELRLLIVFGGIMFLLGLASPLASDGWPGLLELGAGGRYFILPQFAAVAALIWVIGRTHGGMWAYPFAAVLLYMCFITIPREWRYPAFAETGFAREAGLFERARPGTRMTFAIAPNWTMTLVKR